MIPPFRIRTPWVKNAAHLNCLVRTIRTDTTSYFTRPFIPEERGWLPATEDSAEADLKFWKECWGASQNLKSLTHTDLTKYMSIDEVSSTPEAMPLFPVSESIIHGFPQALLRPEYESLYDRVAKLKYEFGNGMMRRRFAVVISGHPGIGKDVFRAFVLYRRCLERKPTLSYSNGDQFVCLFYEGGVVMLPISQMRNRGNVPLDQFTEKTWLLINGGQSIPGQLWDSHSKPQIIFTASPDLKETWRKIWQSSHLGVLDLTMKSWNDSELKYGCALFGMDWATICDRRRAVGPVPRSLFAPDLEYRGFASRNKDKFPL